MDQGSDTAYDIYVTMITEFTNCLHGGKGKEDKEMTVLEFADEYVHCIC